MAVGGSANPARQAMINMMYLVLTALLALNVSKEILDAFVLINTGLENTNVNFEGKNDGTYNAFDRALSNDRDKVKKFFDRAQQAKTFANTVDAHIEELKVFLIAEVDNRSMEEAKVMTLHDVENKGDLNIAPQWLIGDPGNIKTGEWSANELRVMIDKYIADLRGLLDPKVAKAFVMALNTDDVPQWDGTTEPWELGNFYGLPFAAVITNLTRIQAGIRNAEADVIDKIYQNISADDFKFDTLAAGVIPHSNYVILGDTYHADIFVAAFSTTQNPVLELGEVDSLGNFTPLEDSTSAVITYNRGVATYRMAPKTEGPIEWGGILKVKRPDNTWSSYPVKKHFIAAKPIVVVSPTAMNVFYRGLDNPVEVSVPGFAAEELKVNMSNGSISGSKGKFKVRPGRGKEAIVRVTAEKDGQTFTFGQGVKFRVKNVPDPKPYFAGISASGKVQKKKVMAAQGVIAKMENFQFDLKFRVTSYTLSATVKGKVVDQPGRGARLTSGQKTLVKALRGGQKLYIEKIKAKGPDGTTRDLGTIVCTII